MATGDKSVWLRQDRVRRLERLRKAVKAHHGQALAAREAVRATNALLRAEIKARKAHEKGAPKPAASTSPDLFSMELV